MSTTTMSYTKATKNTVVYVADRDDAAIPTLYIKKDTLPKPFPDSITVEVKFDE